LLRGSLGHRHLLLGKGSSILQHSIQRVALVSSAGTRIAGLPAMATQPSFKDDEEREISRGGKATAIWTMSLALFVIAGGVALAILMRPHVSPPTRPGTTSATTTAGESKPPSP
jgi:hypothetical protein